MDTIAPPIHPLSSTQYETTVPLLNLWLVANMSESVDEVYSFINQTAKKILVQGGFADRVSVNMVTDKSQSMVIEDMNFAIEKSKVNLNMIFFLIF